ncbi:hypothetical protein ACIBO5_24770 [Nonomuraea angiospora]|uniref:hypothetical protein n=1 Tax=Nonomuraea angiospora TaxID=46172 RepID=UPI00379F22D1
MATGPRHLVLDEGGDLGAFLRPDPVGPGAARPGIGAEDPVQRAQPAPPVDLGAGEIGEPESAPRSPFDGLPAVEPLVELADLLAR